MATKIGPKIGIDGEAEYRKQMEQIIQQAKTLDAEMKALTTSFDKEASAQEKARASSEQLNKQIENQKTLISELEKMVARSAEATGENSTSTLKWKQQLANARTELNNMEHGLDDATEKTNVFGETLKAMVTKEAIIGGLKAIADGFIAVGKACVSIGKEVVMAYADFEQLEGGVKKLFGEENAQAVIRNAEQAYKSAGLSMNEYMETVTGFSASLISSMGGNTQAAVEVADRAIRDMSDNANTFGTDMQSIQNAYAGFAKGQYTMLDNLKLGYGGTKTEMERLIADAAKMTDIQAELGVTVDGTSLSFENIINAISVMQQSMNIAGTTANEAMGTISGSIGMLKSSFENLKIGLGTDTADIDMLLNNVVESFQAVVHNVEPIVQRLIDYIPKLFDSIAPTIAAMLPELLDTATRLFDSLLNTFIKCIPQLIPVAVQAVTTIMNTLIQNIPLLVDAAVQLILALANGLIDALPYLMEQAPVIIAAIATALIKNFPKIIETGVKLIENLIKGLLSMLGNVGEAMGKIGDSIKNCISDLIKSALNWGRDMIGNLASGIIEKARAVYSAIKDVAHSIWSLLHFSEPEEGPLKDFNDYGPDMMKTFAAGIRKNAYLVEDAARQAAAGASLALNAGVAGGGNAYNYGGFQFAIYQQPGEDADALVDRIMYRIQDKIDSQKAVFA